MEDTIILPNFTSNTTINLSPNTTLNEFKVMMLHLQLKENQPGPIEFGIILL